MQVDFSNISVLTFLGVYAAGVLTSFTPCLYPIIPITVAYIGAKSAGSRSRGFLLSVFYVLGLSAVYSIFGLAAALTGRLFGSVASNPITMILVGNFYLLLALWMLGVFNFQIRFKAADEIKSQADARGAKDYVGSFLVGAASAFAVGPCTAPVLGGLLVWIGGGTSVVTGAILMFVFSLGLGTLLILIGTFAGLTSRLPQSGSWMKIVKIVFGLVLFGVSEYFFIKAGQMLF